MVHLLDERIAFMNRRLKNYFFVLLFPSFLCSCGNTNEYVSLDQYEIKESQTLEEQRVGRASDVWNLNVLVPPSIAPSWSFKTTPVILFKDDCLFTKEETLSFIHKEINVDSFEKEKKRVEDTDFYTYSEKCETPSTWNVKYDTSSLSGKYALYYVTDLQEYTVTPKDGRESFKMYKTNDTLSLELLPAESTR